MQFGIKSALVLEKKFDSEPVYTKKILKNKLKSYSDEATDFHYQEMPKAGSDQQILFGQVIECSFTN